MTPREKRERLFKTGKPYIRKVSVFDGDNYSKDIGILWVAYKKKPFYIMPESLSQDDFARNIVELSKDVDLLVAEDKNKGYKDRGPVALFCVKSDGWKLEPYTEFFPWASKRNILRSVVGFLQYVRFKRKIGGCLISSLKDSLSLLRKCETYGVLQYVGRIPGGNPKGDEYIFWSRGAYVRKHGD